MNKKLFILKKYLAWLPVLIVMAGIFFFSHQPAEESTAVSGNTILIVLHFLEKLTGLPFERLDQETWIALLQTPIRKLAHMTEYTILYLSVLNALHIWKMYGNRLFLIPLVWTAAYACTDEFHQRFIPGRSGSLSDVMIDSLLPTLITLCCCYILRRQKT